jgi:hypothetical protein
VTAKQRVILGALRDAQHEHDAMLASRSGLSTDGSSLQDVAAKIADTVKIADPVLD